MDPDIIKDYIFILQKLKILQRGTYSKNGGLIKSKFHRIYEEISKKQSKEFKVKVCLL